MPQSEETVKAVCLKWRVSGRMPKHLIINDKGHMRMEHAAAILQYIDQHFDSHVTIENLDKAVKMLMRMEKIPSGPPKPQLTEAEKQKRREDDEHKRQVMEMGLVHPNRVNHADKAKEKEKPVAEVVQDLQKGMRSNIQKLQVQIQKPEPKLKRLPLDATKAQLQVASPEQLRDYLARKKREAA
jgi:hypothetical protein